MIGLGCTAAGRALEFVAASDTSTEVLAGSAAIAFMAAAGLAVVVTVALLMLGAARSRRSAQALDRLASRLEGGDD